MEKETINYTALVLVNSGTESGIKDSSEWAIGNFMVSYASI